MEGRLALLLLIGIGVVLICYHLLQSWLVLPVLLWLIIIAISLILALIIARMWTAPLTSRLRALEAGTASFMDSDFSISLSEQGLPELTPIIQTYNQIGKLLREERQSLHQRELLLDTVIQSSPIAMLLVDSRQRIIYSNHAARLMLHSGKKMEGLAWETILEQLDHDIAQALRQKQGGVYSLESIPGTEHAEPESCLIIVKDFRLNASPHTLFMLQRLTRELNRQEVATWKKVIRIISHELNNSVAPISSLVHSGIILAERGDKDRLMSALHSVSERAHHLADFIGQYARFARLPDPQKMSQSWRGFLEPLQQTHPFTIVEPLTDNPGWFDATLMEQVLINLVKNAVEAGSPIEQITIRCIDIEHAQILEVCDTGSGMSSQELKQALAPFYSTKKSGSGIGLALCREIIEAHGGEITLINRQQLGLRVRLKLPLPPTT